MKATKGRVRALDFLSKDGAYALPNGNLPGEFYTIQPMIPVLLSSKMIYESEVKDRKGYVFKITEKGLAWIRSHRLTHCS